MQKYGLYSKFDQLFLVLVCSSSMSSFSFTNFSWENLKHNNILLSSAKFTLDRIQDVTLDFSVSFLDDSNVASRELKAVPSHPVPPATVKTDGLKFP